MFRQMIIAWLLAHIFLSPISYAAILHEIARPLSKIVTYDADTIATFSVSIANSDASHILTITPYTDTSCTTQISGNPYQNYQSSLPTGNYTISGNSVAVSLTLTGVGSAAMTTGDIATIQSFKIRYFGASSGNYCVSVSCTGTTCSPATSSVDLGTLTPAKFIFVSNSTHDADFTGDTEGASLCNGDSNKQAHLEGSVTYKAMISVGVWSIASIVAGITASTNYVNILGQDIATSSSTSGQGFPISISFTNPIGSSATRVWTGLVASTTWSKASVLQSCSSNGLNTGTVLGSNSSSRNGRYGTANATDSNAIGAGSAACNNTYSVYCVQQ